MFFIYKGRVSNCVYSVLLHDLNALTWTIKAAF